MPTHEALLITAAEAAKLLGVSRTTMTRIVNRGHLEQVQIADGMQPRLRRDDVLRLASRKAAKSL